MMSINRDELTSGYRERMRRLALMDSLVVLEGKRTEDLNGKRIDMQGFGMLTLLFFFERRLAREYETSAEHLTLFLLEMARDRKSTRLNSSHVAISYAVFCLKKKKKHTVNRTHS